jgi:hypothetical protein
MEGFKSCGGVMYAHGLPNIGDQHPRLGTTSSRRTPRDGLHGRASQGGGWGDACAGEAIRDGLETIEICSINVELLNRTGSFDDPAWIERRSLAARTRLEAETDPVLLPGCRKIVRKWNEEIMRFQMTVRAKSRMACGNQAGAETP